MDARQPDYGECGRFVGAPGATVIQRGASCEPNITRRTSFIVIGTFGSRDWAHSSYGRKIQHAVKLRESGFAIRIVGEDHWAKALEPLTPEEHPF